MMPIRPETKHLYPKNWKEISNYIRFTRAKGKCEWCGAEHGFSGYRDKAGAFVPEVDREGNYIGDGSCCMADGDMLPKAVLKIVLTTAHIDHDPTNNDQANLAALCQRCHLNHDREQHKENAEATRFRKKAEADQRRGQRRMV